MKIWIVVEIDYYCGCEEGQCCEPDRYSGLSVFTDEKLAKQAAKDIEKQFATGAIIEEREIK